MKLRSILFAVGLLVCTAGADELGLFVEPAVYGKGAAGCSDFLADVADVDGGAMRLQLWWAHMQGSLSALNVVESGLRRRVGAGGSWWNWHQALLRICEDEPGLPFQAAVMELYLELQEEQDIHFGLRDDPRSLAPKATETARGDADEDPRLWWIERAAEL